MGYCMSLVDSKFSIPKTKKAAALKAIKALAGKETIKGGSGPHFSWVDTLGFVKAKSLADAIHAWRWYVDETDMGDVDGIGFDGEKAGDDKILFDAIAPFVEKGSYIEMSGEDGLQWRWTFDGEVCHEDYPEVIWPKR